MFVDAGFMNVSLGGGGSGVLRPMLINLGYWVNRLLVEPVGH